LFDGRDFRRVDEEGRVSRAAEEERIVGTTQEPQEGHGPSKLRVNVPCPYEGLLWMEASMSWMVWTTGV
jgi:hypothetical protein